MQNEIRDGFARLGFALSDDVLDMGKLLMTGDLDIQTELDSEFEIWSPEDWLSLHDALHGWDVTGEFGTQGEAPYNGPASVWPGTQVTTCSASLFARAFCRPNSRSGIRHSASSEHSPYDEVPHLVPNLLDRASTR